MDAQQRAELYGVSWEELAAWCGVNRTTAQRWKHGTAKAPAAALILVRLRLEGRADALLGAAWAGWTFGRDGLLYAPGWRRGYTPGEILGLPYLYGQVRALRRERGSELAEVAERPMIRSA